MDPEFLAWLAEQFGVGVDQMVQLFHVGGGEGGLKWWGDNPGLIPNAIRAGQNIFTTMVPKDLWTAMKEAGALENLNNPAYGAQRVTEGIGEGINLPNAIKSEYVKEFTGTSLDWEKEYLSSGVASGAAGPLPAIGSAIGMGQNIRDWQYDLATNLGQISPDRPRGQLPIEAGMSFLGDLDAKAGQALSDFLHLSPESPGNVGQVTYSPGLQNELSQNFSTTSGVPAAAGPTAPEVMATDSQISRSLDQYRRRLRPRPAGANRPGRLPGGGRSSR